MSRQRIGSIFAVLLFAQILLFGNSSSAQTPTASSWLGKTPILELSQNSLPRNNPDGTVPLSGANAVPCFDTEVVTRNPRPWLFVEKQSHQSCTVNTWYGSLSKTNYLQRPGSDLYGKVLTGSGGATSLLLVPNSNTAIGLGQASRYGHQLYFYKDLSNRIKSNKNIQGDVKHYLPAPDATLVDSFGEKLFANTNSANFSVNGKWMVVNIPNRFTARVNVDTLDILPFGEVLPYGKGINPGITTAISPNGRYAIVTARMNTYFRVYDLSTCEKQLGSDVPYNCQFFELQDFLNGGLEGFTSPSQIRFRSDYTFELNAFRLVEGVQHFDKYIVTAFGKQTQGFSYLALGDSYASGEGAHKYKPFTDIKDNKCHLSVASYPYLLSSSLNFGLFESVACSGAAIRDVNLMTDLYTEDIAQAKNKSIKDVYDNEIYNNFLPGYRIQKEFVTRKKPKIMTMSIGGNDIGFGDIIFRCIDTDTCFDSYEDRYELVQLIRNQFDKLAELYAELQYESTPGSQLYVVGYPQIAKTGGNCGNNVHLNKKELQFTHDLISYLNHVIKKAAEKAGVYYVDTENAFTGARLCEVEDWSVAVNGLTAGNDSFVFGQESFHPNARGHFFLKESILRQTSNLTAPMPAPNPNAKPNDIYNGMPLLSGVPKTNRTIRNLKWATGTDGGVLRFGKNSFEITLGPAFEEASKVKGWLFSQPLYLGEFEVEANGTVNITTEVPISFPSGIHTLHLYGENSSGDEMDVLKTVFVGTPGTGCALVPDSGIDFDQDGTDDACDGFIDKKPAAAIPGKKVALSNPVEIFARVLALTSPVTTGAQQPIKKDTQEPKKDSQNTEASNVLSAKQATQTIASQPKQSLLWENGWFWLVLIVGLIVMGFLVLVI